MTFEDRIIELSDECSKVQADFISKIIDIADKYKVEREELVTVSVGIIVGQLQSIDFKNWRKKDE